MGKKILTLALLLILLLAGGCVPAVTATSTIAREDIFIFADTAGPETTDPAWAYDKASHKLIMNVYETLIWHEVDRTLPQEEQGRTDRFVPCLATNWTVTPDGLNWTFTIREGVKWHDPAYGTLTTEDVEYSIERAMLQDRTGGPAWLLMYPLLGRSDIRYYNDEVMEAIAHALDDAVTSTDTTVTFHCAKPYGVNFLQILASTGFVVNREWCVALGDWPGWEVTGYTWDGWHAWNNPMSSPIDAAGHPMMGTGPYKLDWLTMAVEWSIVANEDYWGSWPSPISDGYFYRAKSEIVEAWILRKAGFLAGDYDSVYVPLPNIDELVVYKDPETGEETYAEGIRCYRELPVLYEHNFFFNFEVETPSDFLLPDEYGLPHGTFDESGTPPDFFSDVDLRKAFAYSFNYSGYINEAFHGEAIQPATHHVKGLAYYNPPPPEGTGPEPFTLDLDKAEEHFKKAWGGSVAEPGPVWTNGFNFNIMYYYGVNEYEAAANMLKTVVEGINPKFHINVRWFGQAIDPWPDPFLAREFVLLVAGWMSEYLDPRNFAHPYMHSDGPIALFMSSYSDPAVYTVGPLEDGWSFVGTSDEIIDAAWVELNLTRREAMDHRLQEIFHERVINMPIAQPTGRRWERDWIKGWYHNQMSSKIYHLWRRLAADLNYDGGVNILDKWTLDANWGPLWQPEVDEYYRADINMDGFVNIKDKWFMHKQWGLEDPQQQ